MNGMKADSDKKRGRKPLVTVYICQNCSEEHYQEDEPKTCSKCGRSWFRKRKVKQ